MTPSLQSLGIDQLPVDQRLQLVGEIWDSIAADVERAPLTEAQKAEIDCRLAAFRANPQSAISWEQVEAETLARLSK